MRTRKSKGLCERCPGRWQGLGFCPMFPPACDPAAMAAARERATTSPRPVAAATVPPPASARPPLTPLRADPPPGRRVLMRVQHLCSWTGYGRLGLALARGLDELGVPVALQSDAADESYGALPDWAPRLYAEDGAADPWELQLATPPTALSPGKRTVAFTMWEATRLKPLAVSWLNKAAAVVVPCKANREWFLASGVRRPIFTVPLGLDPEFRPGPRPSGPFTFGAAGRVSHGGARKGLADVADAFARAAGDMPGSRLSIKCWPDCEIPSWIEDHPRIEVLRRPMTTGELAAWYRSLSVYVTASRGEGWGMQTHQAMGCGVPCLALDWSGTRDFWRAGVDGWPVPHRVEPAGELYAGHGAEWAMPDVDAIAAAMAHAYRSPDEVRAMGAAAAERASRFTWGRTTRSLRNALVDAGMLAGEPDILSPLRRVRACPDRLDPCKTCKGERARCGRRGGEDVWLNDCLSCVG